MTELAQASNSASPIAGWALAVSIVSLIVSLGSVALAFWQAKNNIAEIRRARPNVSGNVLYSENWRTGRDQSARAIMVSLSNRGKESTTVEGILIHEKTSTRVALVNVSEHSLIDGPKLPYRLETHSSAMFFVNINDFLSDRALVYVTLGHGLALEAVATLDEEVALAPSGRTSIGTDVSY